MRHDKAFDTAPRLDGLEELRSACRGSINAVVGPIAIMSRQRRIKVVAAIVLLMAVVLTATTLGFFFVPVSFVYCVRATFSYLPENDDRLAAWLRQQPSVVAHTVEIGRRGIDSKELEVVFIQVRTASGSPPFPLLDEQCAELGYRSDGSRFSDCKR